MFIGFLCENYRKRIGNLLDFMGTRICRRRLVGIATAENGPSKGLTYQRLQC